MCDSAVEPVRGKANTQEFDHHLLLANLRMAPIPVLHLQPIDQGADHRAIEAQLTHVVERRLAQRRSEQHLQAFPPGSRRQSPPVPSWPWPLQIRPSILEDDRWQSAARTAHLLDEVARHGPLGHPVGHLAVPSKAGDGLL